MIKPKMLQLLSLVLVNCGNGLPMVLNGFILIFIRIPPEINTHFVTASMTTKGGVLITVSLSTNGSFFLVSFIDEIVAQLRTTSCELFPP